MNLKKSGRMLWIVAAVAMLAMVLQGCGGDDGVSQGLHDDVVMDNDELMAALAAANAEVTRLNGLLGDADDPAADSIRGMLAAANANVMSLTGMLETANGSVTSLTGDLETANASVMSLTGELETANGNVMSLTGELETANGMVTSLTGELETANGMVTSLTAELGTANADVTRLTGELATANGMVTSLTGELATANGMVTSLTGELSTANGMVTSLTGELATANGMVTSLTGELSTANGMVTSLTGELATANGMVASLTTELDGDGTDANPGLRAQLATANARIAALEDGTAEDVLAPIKTAASDAATAAGTASTAAGTAAGEAETAAENRATIQTGDANSVMDADMARMKANTAADEAMKAATASQMAQDAMDADEARPQRTAAEAAQAEAEQAQMDAETAQGEAEADAMVELKIDDKTKSVGDTSITIDGQSRETTVNDVTRITGLLDGEDIQTPGARDINGRPLVFEGTTVSGRENTAADVDAGFTYDSDDDSARVTLIHSYLGSTKQKQFVRSDDTTPFNGDNGARDIDAPGSGQAGGQDLPPDNDSTNDIPNGSVTIPASAAEYIDVDVTAIPKVAGSAFRSAVRATGVTTGPLPRATLHYVKSGAADTTTGDTDDGIDQTKIFLERDVEAGVVTYNVVNVVEVTIDNGAMFEHIHYGIWNGLSGDGDNTVADLGIGFVQNYSDEGMTDVMPNIGSATYNGNYVANVQVADVDGDGDITRTSGTSTMVANFAKSEVDVTLVHATLGGFVTLEGDIAGNTFSGDKMKLFDTDTTTEGIQNASGLATGGKFDASFSGGFFGTLAAEAGGVFDISSEDNEDGAARGSFGGAR